MTEYLRLAGATAVVLAPGFLVARALGQRTLAAALAWAVAAGFLAWTVVFAARGGAGLALLVLAAVSLLALLAGGAPRTPLPRPGVRAAVLAAGAILGILLWHVAGAVFGDALFHLARVRKLAELGDLHLATVNEFADGGLHPGYAFPLWHGMLALVSEVSGLDPTVVVRHEASVLTPLAAALAWEAGRAVFRSSAAGVAVAVASVALNCLAAGHGGAYVSLALPGTMTLHLLVPAAVTLFFLAVPDRRPTDLAALAAAFGGIALVHPTYALFALVPLGGYALVRLLEWRRSLPALAACLVPTAAVFAWLLPLVGETRSHDPDPAEKLRAFQHYGGMIDVSSPDSYRLAPEVIGRSGAIAVAALVLVPLAGLAVRRRRWAALVLGGTVAMLALLLVPELFTRFSDAVSLSQSRRAVAFVPFVFAFAGGLALLARSVLVLPAALAAGIALQLTWPGDFGYGLREGGPALAAWIAFAGGAVALAAGLALPRREALERHGRAALAAALFALPVAVHGFANWSPSVPADPHALSPELARQLEQVPPRSVILAPPQMAYRMLAAAPVYVVAAPATHVADTEANRPYARIRDVRHWYATRDPAVPRRYGATWAVVDGRLYRLPS